jgi:plasmid stabilization system protein ParE
MKVVVADQVRDFLRSEKAYLQRHSNAAYRRLSRRMRESKRLLSEFPQAGSEKILPVIGIRRLVVDDYVLDYEITNHEVHILNMRHGRQQDPDMELTDNFDFEAPNTPPSKG